MRARILGMARRLIFGFLLCGMATGAHAQSVFSHQVQFKLPKGANGVQPELALTYTPGNGNGPVGVGWDIGGLSEIARAGYGAGVTCTASDTFAHSFVGILVAQADGSYRSRYESFVKVVPSGTCGAGPCSWTVTDRTGMRFVYGDTIDSRQICGGGGTIYRWGLSKAIDLFGNSYEVTYYDDAELLPKTVTYTKGPGISQYRTVEFAYTTRTDNEVSYAMPGRVRTLSKLLSTVTVKANGSTLRSYALTYKTSANSKRALLESVKECGSDGVTCLPAQTFVWADRDTNGFVPKLQYDFSRGDAEHAVTGDFDGDGRADLVTRNGSTVTVTRVVDKAALWTTPSVTVGNVFLTGDFNGDGKTDLLAIGNTTGDVYASTGTSFTHWTSFSLAAAVASPQVADVDGDGKSELLTFEGQQIRVHRLSATGDSSSIWSSAYRNWTSLAGANYIVGDYNGDGRQDLAVVDAVNCLHEVNGGCGNSTCITYAPTSGTACSANGTVYVYLSTGTSFSRAIWAIPAADASTFRKTFGGDFNGDGKSDIAIVAGTSVWVNLSTGASFVQEAWPVANTWAPDPAFNLFNEVKPSYIWAADFNGDGRTDLATRTNATTIAVNTSTGRGFYQASRTLAYDYWGSAAMTWIGDVNGDGTVDVVSASDYGLGTYTSAPSTAIVPPGVYLSSTSPYPGQPNADLLYKVNNGLGGAVTVAYWPSTANFGDAVQPLSTAPGAALASPVPLVRSIASSDGMGHEYITTFRYGDRRYLPGTIPNQRDLGFGWLEERDAQTGKSTVKHFRQDAGYEGLIDKVEAYAPVNSVTSRLLTRSKKTYTSGAGYTCGSTGTELALESSETLEFWDYDLPGSAPAFTQTTSTEYDTCGNPTKKTQAADGLPTIVTTTARQNDTTNWVLGLVARMTTTVGAKTLADMINTWSNLTITSTSNWLDTTNEWVTTYMTYDANGHIYTVSEPGNASLVTRTEYDSTYRAYPWKVTNAAGQPPATRDYTPDGLISTFTDQNGAVTRTEYDGLGRITKETRPDGGITTYGYATVAQAGSMPASVPNDKLEPQSYQRTINRGLVDSVNNRWITTLEFYDGSGFVYRRETTGDDGKSVCRTMQKDSAGRNAVTSLPFYCGATPVWTTTTYDKAGRISTVTAPDGTQTTYGYGGNYETVKDQHGVTTVRTFDARKRVTSIADGLGTTSYTYDELGRTVGIKTPDLATTSITYDSLGRKTSVTAPQGGGANLWFQYDALNRKTAAYPIGSTTAIATFTYDDSAMTNGMGRLTKVVDASGTTTTSYDVMGRPTAIRKVVDGKSYTNGFTYDVAGRLIALSYPEGTIVDYAYTDGGNLGQVKLRGSTGAALAAYSNYTAAGRVQSVQYGNGIGTAFTYDTVGRLTNLKTVNSAAAALQDLTYKWFDYSYVDDGGTTVNGNMNGLTIGAIIDNRASKLSSKNGAQVNTDETQYYRYDYGYRLTSAKGVWGTKAYAYDTTGNPVQFGGIIQRTLTFDGQQVVSGTGLSDVTYDTAGNMLHKKLDGVEWGYTWTADGFLAAATKNGAAVAEMTYDAAGARAKKVFHAADGTVVTTTYVGGGYEKRTYNNGAADRTTINVVANGQILVSITNAGAIATALNEAKGWRSEFAAASMYDPLSLGGGGLKLLHYARALAAHPRTMPTLFWLLFGSLMAAVARGLVSGFLRARAGGSAWSPAFRAIASLLVCAFAMTGCGTDPGGESVLQGGRVEKLLSGGTTFGPQVGTVYYHRNYINSSSVLTDGAGVEITRIVYVPFGEVSQANSDGADVATGKFTGKELDEELGIYNYGARYYDPAMGRFLSADSVVPSVTDAQAYNRYAYVRNSPVIYTDPSGHSWLGDIFDGIGDAFHAAGQAIGWAAGKVGGFIGKAWDLVGKWYRGIVSNPTSLALFAAGLILCLSVACGNPGGVALGLKCWSISVAASVAVQAVAYACGVRNPYVLNALSIVALSGSYAAMAYSLGKWGVGEALTAVAGPGFSAVAMFGVAAASEAAHEQNESSDDQTADAGMGESRAIGPSQACVDASAGGGAARVQGHRAIRSGKTSRGGRDEPTETVVLEETVVKVCGGKPIISQTTAAKVLGWAAGVAVGVAVVAATVIFVACTGGVGAILAWPAMLGILAGTATSSFAGYQMTVAYAEIVENARRTPLYVCPDQS